MPIRNIRYREALREAMIEEMERDSNVMIMGEEVGHYDGAYKVTEGMLKKFGDKRVLDTPIAEAGFTGVAIGASLTGLRPIVEFMTWNFSAVAFDQILNNAAKLRQMSGGQFTVPIVLRGPNASAKQVGSQHSHAMEHFYATVPGLKVVTPAFPQDAKGLLKSAIRDNNPVLCMESETLYSVKGDVDDSIDTIPLGVANVVRAGTKCTIVAYSRMTHVALEAAVKLQDKGIDVEVVDLRSLRPLDEGTILRSVKKTHRCVVVHEGWSYGGVGAEIADRVQRLAFNHLDAPILRVTSYDAPMPYNATLEQICNPTSDRVVSTVLNVINF
jgi:pyruvate dehydrogenase E1 component beta subunit